MEQLSGVISKVEKHAAFLRRLYGSSFGVFVVAAWLHSLKRTVTIHPIDSAPFGEDPNKYVDAGDLISTKENGESSLLEVKHINTDFTCLEDWPHKDMIVSNVKAVDRRQGQVTAYIMLSKDANYIAILPGETKGNWKKIKRFAKNTQMEEDYYVCDPAFCKFVFIGEKE